MARTAITTERLANRNYPNSIKVLQSGSSFMTVTADASINADLEDACTYLIWLKLDKTFEEMSTSSRIFAYGGTTGNDRNIELFGNQNTGVITMRSSNNVTFQALSSTTVLQKGQWYLVGVRYEKDGNMGLIVNGAVENETAVTVNAVMNTRAMHIGSFSSGAVSLMDGHIGPMLIFDEALSDQEISDYYYSGIVPTGGNIKFQMDLTEGTGNPTDSSSESNTISLQGGASWSQVSPFKKHKVNRSYDNALYFDGSATPDARVTNFDPTGLSGQVLSVAAWYKQSATGVGGAVISQFDYGVNDRSWNIAVTTGDLMRVTLSNNGTAILKRFESPFIVADGRWHLLGFTWNGATETLALYVDGLRIAPTVVTSNSGSSVHSSSADIMLGSNLSSDSDVDKLTGFVGPAWIWSSVLTGQEMHALYADAIVPSDNLEAEWLMGEGTGNTAADTSGNSRNATLGTPDWQSGPFVVRDEIDMVRIPETFSSDYGVNNAWDFRTGYLGDDSEKVVDIEGGFHMNGVSITSTNYTTGEFSTDLDGSADYYRSNDTFGIGTIDDISIGTWINWPSANFDDNRGIVGKWSNNSKRSWLLVGMNNGDIRFYISNDGSQTAANYGHATTSGQPLSGDAWEFVTMTYDKSEDTVIFYVDGVVAASSQTNLIGGISMFDTPSPITIGAYLDGSDAPTNYINGKVGVTFLAYDKVWTAGEVSGLYNMTKAIYGY